MHFQADADMQRAPPPRPFFLHNTANSTHCAGPHCFSLTMLHVILGRIIYQQMKNFPTLYLSCQTVLL